MIPEEESNDSQLFQINDDVPLKQILKDKIQNKKKTRVKDRYILRLKITGNEFMLDEYKKAIKQRKK